MPMTLPSTPGVFVCVGGGGGKGGGHLTVNDVILGFNTAAEYARHTHEGYSQCQPRVLSLNVVENS